MLDVNMLIDAKNLFNKMTENMDPSTVYDEDGFISSESSWYAFKDICGIKVNHGVSKCALIPQDKPFVFKFSLTKNINYDYCWAEAQVYQNAREEGLDCYLAQIEYLLTFGDIRVFIQEKVDCFENPEFPVYIESDRSDEHYNLLEEIAGDYNSGECIPLDWAVDFAGYYSDTDFDEFCRFLDDYNVNDLHEGNLGYINSRPIVFDYSGWFG